MVSPSRQGVLSSRKAASSPPATSPPKKPPLENASPAPTNKARQTSPVSQHASKRSRSSSPQCVTSISTSHQKNKHIIPLDSTNQESSHSSPNSSGSFPNRKPLPPPPLRCSTNTTLSQEETGPIGMSGITINTEDAVSTNPSLASQTLHAPQHKIHCNSSKRSSNDTKKLYARVMKKPSSRHLHCRGKS